MKSLVKPEQPATRGLIGTVKRSWPLPDAANDALLHAWIHPLSLIAGMCIIAAVPRSRRQFGFGAERRRFTLIQPLDVSVLPFSRIPGHLTKSGKREGGGRREVCVWGGGTPCCEEALRSCERLPPLAAWSKPLAGSQGIPVMLGGGVGWGWIS